MRRYGIEISERSNSKNLSMTWEIEMNRVAVAVLCCSYCENVSDYRMLPKGNLVLISLIRKKLSFFLDQNPLFSLFLTLLLTFLEKRCCNFLGGKLRKRFHFHEFFFYMIRIYSTCYFRCGWTIQHWQGKGVSAFPRSEPDP